MKIKLFFIVLLFSFILSGCKREYSSINDKGKYCDILTFSMADYLFDIKEKGVTKEQGLDYLNSVIDDIYKSYYSKINNKDDDITPPLFFQLRYIYEILYESNYKKHDFENKVMENCIYYKWEFNFHMYNNFYL